MLPAVAVAALLATAGAAAPLPDTSLRVPGTALRFGSSLAQVGRVVPTRPAAPAAAGAVKADVTTRAARVRFFGLEGEATLEFEAGALARARVKVSQPSPHDIDYVEDDLARQGFRRRCDQREGVNRKCEWTARARVFLTTSAAGIEAEMEPAAGLLPAAAAAETLAFTALSGGDPPSGPVVLDSCVAVRPDIARQSGIFGRVVVEVSADTSGRVTAARVVRGVPTLDDAALECARRFRFAPCLRDGRARPFRVPLSIRFTL